MIERVERARITRAARQHFRELNWPEFVVFCDALDAADALREALAGRVGCGGCVVTVDCTGTVTHEPMCPVARYDALVEKAKFALAVRAFLQEQRPRIVCLCGSTRFFQTFQEANLQETVAGKIVLSIGCDLRSDHQLWADPSERERIKRELDVLHCRKIDLADDVLVLNVGGYVGDSTQREIRYALAVGKPIRWWEPQNADAILALLRRELGDD
jgi:hypothetical protein